jgi:hypothetical protein
MGMMGPGGPMAGGPPSMQSTHLQSKPLFPSAAAIVTLSFIYYSFIIFIKDFFIK